MTKKREVFIVDGARSPFLKVTGKPNPLSAADLAVAVTGPLLARQPFLSHHIGEVITGCVGPASDEANIARIIALRSGCGDKVPAWTVQRNCASGLQALAAAAIDIANGDYDLVLAGGTECMSRAPLIYQNRLVEWLADFRTRKGLMAKIQTLFKLRPQFLTPVISLLNALTDPVVNLSMGQTAENLVYQFQISREAADAFSVASHQRAVDALKNGLLKEIIPIFDWQGNVVDSDTGIRGDASLEKLAGLKPVFDKPFGSVTAGNSSQITDGAAFLILASESAIKRHRLPVLAKIIDTEWAALDPALMGLGPRYAIQKLLTKNHLQLDDIDYWEINEAFASQVLACLKALEQENIGKIPLDRLNVDGGAVAIGHPVGATGARLVLHLVHVLARNKAKYGVASLCIGGGQGGAMLIERVTEIVKHG